MTANRIDEAIEKIDYMRSCFFGDGPLTIRIAEYGKTERELKSLLQSDCKVVDENKKRIPKEAVYGKDHQWRCPGCGGVTYMDKTMCRRCGQRLSFPDEFIDIETKLPKHLQAVDIKIGGKFDGVSNIWYDRLNNQFFVIESDYGRYKAHSVSHWRPRVNKFKEAPCEKIPIVNQCK